MAPFPEPPRTVSLFSGCFLHFLFMIQKNLRSFLYFLILAFVTLYQPFDRLVTSGILHHFPKRGDVKYHMGFSSDIETDGGLVHLALAFNPSHLEIVSPVVIGSVRARLDRLDEPSSNKVLPITIHGDAAITGQGVVFFYFILEVLSFSDFYLISSFPRFWGILSIQPLPAERQIPL